MDTHELYFFSFVLFCFFSLLGALGFAMLLFGITLIAGFVFLRDLLIGVILGLSWLADKGCHAVSAMCGHEEEAVDLFRVESKAFATNKEIVSIESS